MATSAKTAAAFKPKASDVRLAKADQTTEAARAINEANARAHAAKTEKLRALRLEREAAEAAEKEAAPKKKAAKKAV